MRSFLMQNYSNNQVSRNLQIQSNMKYKKYTIEQILEIKPVWITEVKNIDLELQPDQLTDKYIKGGFHIYQSSWEDLKMALYETYCKLYDNKILWSKNQQPDKINKVLLNWDNKIPLIPPMLIDNSFDKLLPADGKHRLKVASILNPKEITFILFDCDLEKINKYFNPKKID